MQKCMGKERLQQTDFIEAPVNNGNPLHSLEKFSLRAGLKFRHQFDSRHVASFAWSQFSVLILRPGFMMTALSMHGVYGTRSRTESCVEVPTALLSSHNHIYTIGFLTGDRVNSYLG